MNYNCPDCKRPIGLMADKNGKPQMFKCIRTGRAVGPQLAISRETPTQKRDFDE